MHILYLSGRELNYSRNQTLLKALQELGTVEVFAEYGKAGSILWRSLRVGLKALPRLFSEHYDLVFVGFYGYLLMIPVSILARKPVLFDAFVSNFDTLIEDRQIEKANSWLAKLALFLDRIGCRFADHILLDTATHVHYFVETLRRPVGKFTAVPVGCDEQIFHPSKNKLSADITVLYYCTYLPVHGVDVVVRAAALLDNPKIHFRLIGNGPEYSKVQELTKELKVRNITFLPPVSLDQLAEEIGSAAICLCGHFGTSGKSSRVIAGKTYQCIAMGKPVIVGDNAANRELLTHQWDAWFCPMGDPDNLASAIHNLAEDCALRDRIGGQARLTFLEKASTDVVNRIVKEVVYDLLPGISRERR